MSVVLPLLLATSLSVSPVTGGVTGPSEPSFTNIFQLNNQIGTETYIPPKSDTWDGTYSQYDGYDAYLESNDTYDKATPLVDPLNMDFRNKNHWKTSVDACLNSSLIVPKDQDFYYFSLFSDSVVSLCLEMPFITAKYGIHLEKLTYSGIDFQNRTAGKEAVELASFETGSGKNGFSLSFTPSKTKLNYTGTLEAGTYYLNLENITSLGQYPSFRYHFDLEVTCLDRSSVYEISDLRYNKEIGAAMWRSDFRPLSLDSVLFDDLTDRTLDLYDGIRYQDQDNMASDPLRDYALEAMKRDAKGKSLVSDCLYIWNKNVASDLLAPLQNIEDFLSLKKNRIIRTKEKIEVAMTVTETVTTLAFIGLEIAGVGSPVVILVGNLTRSVLDIVQVLVNCLIDRVYQRLGQSCPDETYVSNLISVIHQLRNLLQIKAGVPSQGLSGNYLDTLVIPLTYYRIYDEGSTLRGRHSKVKFSQLFSPDQDSDMMDSILYKETRLYSTTDFDMGCGGKFYAITQEDSIKDKRKVDEYGDVLKKPTPYVYNSLDSSTGISDRIYEGDYRWYSFTAPKEDIYVFLTRTSILIEDSTQEKSLIPVTFAVNELFSEVVAGQKNSGFAVSDYTYANGTYLSYIDYPLEKGQTIYIRVRGDGYKAVSTIFKILDSSMSEIEAYHVHTGTRYTDDEDYHSLRCWHDDTALKRENHNYSDEMFLSDGTAYRICLTCRHRLSYQKYHYDHGGSQEM